MIIRDGTVSRESLEELRVFTNINSGKAELLQLVLVGQPELRDLIRRPELTQFAQRVSAAFHLEAMDAPTVRAYIRHHLAVAGTASLNRGHTRQCNCIGHIAARLRRCAGAIRSGVANKAQAETGDTTEVMARGQRISATAVCVRQQP